MRYLKFLKTFSLGLLSLIIVLNSSAQAQISAEEKRKRELFLKLRTQQQTQPTRQRSAPTPTPKARPKPTPRPRQQYRPSNQRPPQPTRVIRKSVPTPQPRTRRATTRPPAPAPRPQQVRRPSAPPQPKGPSFGQRLKNIAQNTRQRLESLPRTNQSLGTPQEHAVSSNPYESADDYYTPPSKAGPPIADLKPRSRPTYTPAPKPKAKPKPRTSAIAKSKPKSKSKSTPSKSAIANAATKLAKKAPIDSKLKKRIITESTPAADALVAAAKTLDKKETKKIATPKVAPRTLIASLEKYIPIPAEQLIGEAMSIDLDDADLEPLTMHVKNVANQAIAKTQKSISTSPPVDIDPADIVVGEEPSAQLTAVMESTGDTPPTGQTSANIQPLGMSFFERFALSTMVATENHLASIPKPDAPPTAAELAATAAEEIQEPVILEDPEAVKFVSNDIPPTHVSPGLDEMVISSTSQTDFDLNDSEMAFIGNVQVKSPQFNLRADKFIVHLKKDNSGMAFGEAIGNVVIEMRENGRPTGYSGLASNAVYHPTDGKITLSGWPKIRQQYKEHVAVTRDTKMVLYTDGRVKTIGRNRTVIRK